MCLVATAVACSSGSDETRTVATATVSTSTTTEATRTTESTLNSEYGGYSAVADTSSVSASFTVTAVECTGRSGAALGVTLADSEHAAALNYLCDNGDLKYFVEVRVHGRSTVVPKPAAVGDQIVVTVKISGGTVTATVRNSTRDWTVNKSGQAVPTTRAFIGASELGAIGAPLAHFEPTVYTSVRVGSRRLDQTNPTRVIMTGSGNVVQLTPSPITNGDQFTNTWKHA